MWEENGKEEKGRQMKGIKMNVKNGSEGKERVNKENMEKGKKRREMEENFGDVKSVRKEKEKGVRGN